MKSQTSVSRLFSLLLVLTGFLLLAPGARADEQDPPSRVARISYLQGSVSFQPSGAGEWSNAVLNRPMTVGDRLWTDSKARAELQTGAALIHLNESTALSLLNLDDRTVQMRMAEGELSFRVREVREGELYEVDTPNLAFTVTRAGAFRVDVSEAGDFTGVTVFRGEAEVTAGGRNYTVREGERAEFRGLDKLEYNIFPAPRADKFDRWALERNLRAERSYSSRYVSRDVIGYEDLDDYGYWREVYGYGHVWYPRTVAVGWAPYRYGHWAWVDPWGWTWVDYEPWGFAPFHYGRWAYVGGLWGWCPGPLYVRPIYAPALVAFIGGANWGVSFGFGGGWGQPVGWFPLGYGEPYYPWYRSSRAYITNVNITNTTIRNVNIINNTTNINNFRYRHERDSGAVTAVSQRSFVNGEAVQHASLRLTHEALRNAQVTHRAAEIAPTDRSRMGAAGRERVALPPAAVENRAVMSRTAPAEAARNLPVRPAHPSGELASRGAMANREGARLNGRVGVPDAAPLSARERELNQARPPSSEGRDLGRVNPRQGIESRGEVRPNAQGNARPDRPSTGERMNPRSAERPAEMQRAPERQTPDQHRTQADRPPWARSSASDSREARPRNSGERGYGSSAPQRGSESRAVDRSVDRPANRPAERSIERPAERPTGRSVDRSIDRPGRSYDSPREYSRPAPSYDRGGSRAPESPRYSAPPRSYPAPRTQSAPPRTYSAPPRTYSAPPRSSGNSGGYSAPRGSSGGGGRGAAPPSSPRGGGPPRGRDH